MAHFADLSKQGETAYERGELGVALSRLRAANEWALKAGQKPRDLRPLEDRWAELRRVRAELAFHQAACELADGDLAEAARLAQLTDATDDDALMSRLTPSIPPSNLP